MRQVCGTAAVPASCRVAGERRAPATGRPGTYSGSLHCVDGRVANDNTCPGHGPSATSRGGTRSLSRGVQRHRLLGRGRRSQPVPQLVVNVESFCRGQAPDRHVKARAALRSGGSLRVVKALLVGTDALLQPLSKPPRLSGGVSATKPGFQRPVRLFVHPPAAPIGSVVTPRTVDRSQLASAKRSERHRAAWPRCTPTAKDPGGRSRPPRGMVGRPDSRTVGRPAGQRQEGEFLAS